MNYLNLSPGAAPLVIKVSEGDIGREISFTLVEDGLEYSIPTGSTITCEILKSDGHGTSIPCTWSGSVVTFETTEQSTIRAGKATAELRIVNGADDIGTANFIMAVEPRPINADTDQTDSSYSQTGDAGDVWTLGSNGVPSWAPSGLDASSATAGQAPIADGEGGWAWGDVATSGDSVPTEVRQALYSLLNNNAFANDSQYTSQLAVLQSWATEITAISVSPTTLNINGINQQTIVATTQPTGGIVTWTSSDPTVATVSGGVVTPTGVNGSCVITATCGGKSATCAVTVSGFATLLSISAVYTQSGTVYDSDTLDSLKSDLVVTGTYDDSRTLPITDYVLSGTLAEGTSTIVVSYGGKTTTFNVTVTEYRGIPEDYTWLYDARNGELLSAQNYVTKETGGGGGTEELANDELVLTAQASEGTSQSNFLRYLLSDSTTTNGKLTCRAKFVNGQDNLGTTGASGFRLQLSNGTSGGQAFFLNNNGNITVIYYEGSTRKTIDTNFSFDNYHVYEIELANGSQKFSIDGTQIFSSSTLSTNYCTANAVLNQASTVTYNSNGITTNIDWLAYYEVA